MPPLTTILSATLVTLGPTLSACVATDDAAGGPDDSLRLFTATAEPSKPPALAAEPWALRFLEVEPNERLFDDGVPAVGDTLAVDLFDGEQVAAQVAAVTPALTGSNVRARVLDPHSGHVLLTIGEGQLSGSVRLDRRQYAFYVRYDQEAGQHFLVEVDPEQEDVFPEAPPEEAPPEEGPPDYR